MKWSKVTWLFLLHNPLFINFKPSLDLINQAMVPEKNKDKLEKKVRFTPG